LGLLSTGLLLALSLTLFSSFTHEVLHGHPFRNSTLNAALVFPALGLLVPYERFRDTHLAHHNDPILTDPYDDPESNFVDPKTWIQWSVMRRVIYTVNNTLLGRMMIGPLIGLATFYTLDIQRLMAGNRPVIRAYILHGLGIIPVLIWFVTFADMPIWLYFVAVYTSNSILRIRTFLEHRAHERARCRSVIIEDRGVLSFLFLNNNLHAVHHACPNMPWYHLRAYYAGRRSAFLERNGGYAYRSYLEIMRLFLVRTKDPVPHNLWPQEHDFVPAKDRTN
jgi:fatty acid desaturase